ncbi:MAG: hypothetical protein U5Q44_15390 [Dehalococcoidia bacterium]|nr:hypothetical protein [Dehalococcoidia bacterium]
MATGNKVTEEDRTPAAAANGDNGDPTTAPSNGGNGGGEGNYGGTVRYPYTGTSSGDPPTLFPWENITYRPQNQASLPLQAGCCADVRGPHVAPPATAPSTGRRPARASDAGAARRRDVHLHAYATTSHFHDKEPMNGRQATAQDVAEPNQAFISISPNAATWENVIDRFEAVDDRTIEVQLDAHAPVPHGAGFHLRRLLVYPGREHRRWSGATTMGHGGYWPLGI